MQCVIEKENNFKQPGERYRSFDPARFATCDFYCSIVLHTGVFSPRSILLLVLILLFLISGKRDSLRDGLMHCLTLESPMKSGAFGYLTGLRLVYQLLLDYYPELCLKSQKLLVNKKS